MVIFMSNSIENSLMMSVQRKPIGEENSQSITKQKRSAHGTSYELNDRISSKEKLSKVIANTTDETSAQMQSQLKSKENVIEISRDNLEVIGEGGCGIVYKLSTPEINDGEPVAFKPSLSEEGQGDLEKESKIYVAIGDNDNIAKSFGMRKFKIKENPNLGVLHGLCLEFIDGKPIDEISYEAEKLYDNNKIMHLEFCSINQFFLEGMLKGIEQLGERGIFMRILKVQMPCSHVKIKQ